MNMSDLDAPPAHFLPLRRSATLPTKLLPRKQPSSDTLNASANTLYYHPSAKIVHFSPRAVAPIPSSTAPSDFDYPVDTVETLPWRSPTERTVALGPLRLEKGLTVFLKCGSVVHAILKNSQCWCVDGESTFVLRIRPLTYYRIEIPNQTDEDKGSVAELKTALPNILRYEVTPCPFKRGFTVEIPEEAKVPRRRRAWRPKGKRESTPARLPEPSSPNTAEEPDTSSVGEETGGSATDDSPLPSKDPGTPLETIPDENETPEPLQISTEVLPRRSVTEPQQSFDTLLARFEANTEPHVDDSSFSSSVESFHSPRPSSPLQPPSSSHSNSTAPTSIGGAEHVQGEPQDCESPVQSPKSADIISGPSGKPLELPNDRDESVVHVPALDASRQSSTSFFSVPSEQSLRKEPTNSTSSSSDNMSDMSAKFRRRTKATRERDLSPMPPQSTLYRSNSNHAEDSPASIIQKTCTIVLIPPIQLLVILLHIAARIVIGPALNTAMRDLNKKLEDQVDHPQDAVDDFGLPLAVESSSSTEPEQPQAPAKSDPWDLD